MDHQDHGLVSDRARANGGSCPIPVKEGDPARQRRIVPARVSTSGDALQVAVHRNRDRQTLMDALVDHEFRVRAQVFGDRRVRAVAFSPGAAAAELGRHVLHDGVEDHAVTAHAGQGRIALQFGQHLLVRVIAVQADQDTGMPGGDRPARFDDARIGAGVLRLDSRVSSMASVSIASMTSSLAPSARSAWIFPGSIPSGLAGLVACSRRRGLVWSMARSSVTDCPSQAIDGRRMCLFGSTNKHEKGIVVIVF